VATVVQGTADVAETGGGPPGAGSFEQTFDDTPAAGNLLVLYYGARDQDSNQTPVFTMPDGWTKAVEVAGMEFHSVGIAFKTSEGDESGAVTVTSEAACRAWWIGLVEFNEDGVSSWELDKTAEDGTGAGNASSIASGSTGVLGAAVGVAAIAGTSRTANEGLSTNLGTSLASENAAFEVDAGQANFIAAWLSLTATDALDATISESTGSSRMGAAIATFISAVGGVPPITGTGALVEDPDVAAAAGTSTPPPITGTGAILEDEDVGVGEGATAQFLGSGEITEDPDVATGSGTFTPPPVTGTGAVTEDPDTAVGEGTFTAPPTTGTGAIIEDGDAVAGSGTSSAAGITGTGALVEDEDVITGSGTYTPPPVTGTGSIVEDGDVMVGAGIGVVVLHPPGPAAAPLRSVGFSGAIVGPSGGGATVENS
jgi:hypothetical protein